MILHQLGGNLDIIHSVDFDDDHGIKMKMVMTIIFQTTSSTINFYITNSATGNDPKLSAMVVIQVESV